IGRGGRRAGANQLGEAAKLVHLMGGDQLAAALHYPDGGFAMGVPRRIFRRLPQREGTLFHKVYEDRIGIAAANLSRPHPLAPPPPALPQSRGENRTALASRSPPPAPDWRACAGCG